MYKSKERKNEGRKQQKFACLYLENDRHVFFFKFRNVALEYGGKFGITQIRAMSVSNLHIVLPADMLTMPWLLGLHDMLPCALIRVSINI